MVSCQYVQMSVSGSPIAHYSWLRLKLSSIFTQLLKLHLNQPQKFCTVDVNSGETYEMWEKKKEAETIVQC